MATAGMTAADQAVITREMARATAHRMGHRVIFSPRPSANGIGNGVHIHMSLQDAAGTLLAFMRWAGGYDWSEARAAVSAPASCITCRRSPRSMAPSPVSYLRLVPDRWAPTAVDIVQQDRGASFVGLPRCSPPLGHPEIARQYNFGI